MIRRFMLASTACLLLALLTTAEAAAATGPEWKLTVAPSSDYVIPGSATFLGTYAVEAENVGDQPTSGAVTIEDLLPVGTSAAASELYEGSEMDFYGKNPDTSEKPLPRVPGHCPTIVRCEYPAESPPIQPHQRLVLVLAFRVSAKAAGQLETLGRVSGGSASSAEAAASVVATSQPPLGPLDLGASLTDSAASPYTQAGGHPYEFASAFRFGSYSTQGGRSPVEWNAIRPAHEPKQIVAELPAGLLADPQGVPTCTLADFYAQECGVGAQVGTNEIYISAHTIVLSPVFNLQPTGAYPGELGSVVANLPVVLITAGLRSGSDYGVTATATASENEVARVRLTLWGVPASPSHDSLRGKECTVRIAPGLLPSANELGCEEQEVGGVASTPAGVPPTPFLTLPSACSGNPLPFRGRYNSWDLPLQFAAAEVELSPVDGCNQLGFQPSIEAHPTTNLADAPSGLEFDLHVPQNEDPEGVATPDLDEAVVALPKGLSINPSSGNGLAGCSPEQIGLVTAVGETPAHFSEEPAQCPDASKLGTAVVDTPLLHNPLEGAVYLASPHQNPFGSLLAAYIVLEGEGVIIKLPGKIETDPQTGQITGRFIENPQTPFEGFHLNFFGGARGDLRTPAVCGSYETTSVLTPYSAPESGPPAEPSSHFEVTNGGTSCPGSAGQQPHAPAFRAGTESASAGAFSPLGLRLSREDGSQEISKIETTLPPGLTGKLAGVTECSGAQIAAAEHNSGEAEKASPSCPASSEVGTVEVASGAGPTPLYVTGHAYLSGPYKGAPLSLAIVTPAVAGPFDLGDVVVRTALYTDPYTAQIKAVSDPIPHILEGIPLDVRSITLRMSRPNFTLNPTDCEELGFSGTATSVLGVAAPLSQRFQVGGCRALPFRPKLALKLKGGTRRHTFPALTATLTMPPGQANIAKAQVTLPHSAFLEQSHITSQVCTQPELAARSCPRASIYGYAKAETPLLDHPLEGPVYLGVGFGHQLPDLVAELNGQIRVLLHGKVDTGREDGLRNTFEVVPDAPVSKFTLHLFGGKKSLIVNHENLCGKHAKRKALARFTAQSGKVVELEPTIANSCKKGTGGKGKKRRGG
jgi:hypothetical protein